MISFRPSQSGDRALTGDTPYGKFDVQLSRAADSKPLRIIDAEGNEVGTASIIFREPLPADSDTQARAAKQGGCCGEPTE